MNWFDTFMDNCKNALMLSTKKSKIFLPYIIYLFIQGAVIIFSVAFAFAMGISFIGHGFEEIIMKAGTMIIFLLLIVGIGLPIMYCMVEAGTLAMIKKLLETGNTVKQDFFDGLKKYWFRYLVGISIVWLCYLAIFIVALIPTLLAELLTLGYGTILCMTIVNVFFGIWSVIMVAEDIGGVKAVKRGIEFGKKNFWLMFLLIIASTLISKYAVGLVSIIPLLGFLATPFVGAVVGIYFKIVMFDYYNEQKKQTAEQKFEAVL